MQLKCLQTSWFGYIWKVTESKRNNQILNDWNALCMWQKYCSHFLESIEQYLRWNLVMNLGQNINCFPLSSLLCKPTSGKNNHYEFVGSCQSWLWFMVEVNVIFNLTFFYWRRCVSVPTMHCQFVVMINAIYHFPCVLNTKQYFCKSFLFQWLTQVVT